MRMRLEHVGIVVKDIDAAREQYAALYGCAALTPVVDEPAHGVRVQLLDAGHGPMPSIELVEPATRDSRVAAFLAKTGGGLHHLAYAVADLDAALAHLRSHGAMPLGPAVMGAAHRVRTAWLFTPARELIELIELGAISETEGNRP